MKGWGLCRNLSAEHTDFVASKGCNLQQMQTVLYLLRQSVGERLKESSSDFFFFFLMTYLKLNFSNNLRRRLS